MAIKTRRHVLPAFLSIILFSFVLYGIMIAIESREISILFSYEKLEQLAGTELLYTILWFFGDMTEAHFYKSFIGGIGLIIFAFIAHQLDKNRSKFAGISISYGSGLWPWVFLAGAIGLAMSIALYGHLISEEGWIPTFVPFLSIPGAVVLIYGGGWKNTLTASILGGLIGFPISWFVISVLLQPSPIEIPNVIGNVSGMWIGAIIVFEICKHLPWMKQEEEEQPNQEENDHEEEIQEVNSTKENRWFIRRSLADFSEAVFFANEWASIGLLLGVIITWLLNPFHVSYGSGLLPAILLSQFLSVAVANFLYYDQWEKYGWYPTFVPIVSVAPAVVLTFGGSLLSIFSGAILGAIIGPPLAQMIINKSPKHWHPVVGNTFSMGLTTLLVVLILNYLPIF